MNGVTQGISLDVLHDLLGHYARVLADLQKGRVGMGNRTGAIERDGLPADYAAPISAAADALHEAEKAMDRALVKLAKQHFMADWICNAPGIGLPGFARLLGATGPLSNFPNVAKLWAYCGMAVVHGQAPKRAKGQKANWSPQARVICHQLGDSIVKLGRGKYREAYDAKKAYYHKVHPEWTDGHSHNAAMRYAVKELLKDMWVEWHRRVKE